MEFSAESQRRAAIRVLRPWLASARLVALFYSIGELAVRRPGSLATIEMIVNRMAKRSAAATLARKNEHRVAGW